MLHLNKGDYFGEKKTFFDFRDILVTNTITAPKEAPLHYHENAYFSYFIKGHLKEKNKKETYYCSPGTLIYHHSQDPHQNRNEELVHNLNIELTKNCFERFGIKQGKLDGTTIIRDPALIAVFEQVYKEIMINDQASRLSIEGLLLQAFGILVRSTYAQRSSTPKWVQKIRDYLHAETGSLDLETAAKEVGLHPGYLSQAFPKYFHTSLGDYVRKIRLQKATSLLKDKNHSLCSISYECGFSDQSHFIRCFRELFQMTPRQYRKSVLCIN